MNKEQIDPAQRLLILEGIEGFDKMTFITLMDETSEEVAFSILHEFMNTLKDSLAQLDQASSLGREDFEHIAKICHRVKGSSQLVGLENLTKSAEELRIATKGLLSPKSRKLINDFRAQCLLVERELMRVF